MSAVTLDWSAAEVSDGRLEVPLRGGFSKGWKEDFDRTVALLPSGDWGEVTLKKERVRVEQVPEGCEDRLRHFLEGVVLQANAKAEAEAERERRDEDTEEERSDQDAAMTGRFRSFATDGDRAEP